MTTHEGLRTLAEKLRRVESSARPSDWSGIREVTTNWYRNPDGPEAADALTALQDDNERMREWVERMAGWLETSADRHEEAGKDERFKQLSDARKADARNFRKMASDGRAALSPRGAG